MWLASVDVRGDGGVADQGTPAATRGVIGWDVGGVNLKVARVARGKVRDVRWRPYELQRAPEALGPSLRELAVEVGADAEAHAVTMTAELSQMFRTKRDGVSFVVDAVEVAFPSTAILVYAVDGRFLSPEQARREPLAVAAANWAATARAIAPRHPDALLLDVGTTTTDIIPIVAGVVAAEGRTDPERLASGELVYTGALRTPTEAIASHVPLGGALANVSAEGFALAGDVHVWRGDLAPADYTVATPDGRPATRAFAAERLARVVCADREQLDDDAVSSIAAALADAQVARIAAAIGRVLARHRSLRTAVITGLGAFLADAAARAAGLQVLPLALEFGPAAARCAPATAVAVLLERALAVPGADHPCAPSATAKAGTAHSQNLPSNRARAGIVQTVVKVGGSVLAHQEHFDAVMTAIGAATPVRRLLIVPGGGPFADTVRDVDRRLGLPDDAAHWMAVLAMDQYAHLIAARLTGGVLVTHEREIAAALDAGGVPVLAPSRLLRESDPLPHAWTVTSDSIAAWVVGRVGARHLVLVKPPDASLHESDQPVGSGGDETVPESVGRELVDSYFHCALPAGVTCTIVRANRADALRSALAAGLVDR
jgi:probable H4MPT-linked C1 transfer pathway protein